MGVYSDEGVSGKHGRDKRPQFDELMKDATRRKFDLIMSWDVSRLGRSLKHLVEFMEDIQSKNIDLYLHANGLDSSTSSGRAMFGMLSVFSTQMYDTFRFSFRDHLINGIQKIVVFDLSHFKEVWLYQTESNQLLTP